jgi:hypothetical protein
MSAAAGKGGAQPWVIAAIPKGIPATTATWRRPLAACVVGYCALAGGAIALWLLDRSRTGLGAAVGVCALPALAAALLAWRADADNKQFVAKLLAVALFAPFLVGLWAGAQRASDSAALWPAGVAAALLHAAAFVTAIVMAGRRITRQDASAGVARVDLQRLQVRLASLVDAGVPVAPLPCGDATQAGFMLLGLAPGRSHQVRLRLDPATHCVYVQERLGADRARPGDAEEASLRRVGDPIVDAARPQAQRVGGTTWQTSMLDPTRLAMLAPTFTDDDHAQLAPAASAPLDADGVVTLLCAVVIGSGWHWRPGWRT